MLFSLSGRGLPPEEQKGVGHGHRNKEHARDGIGSARFEPRSDEDRPLVAV